MGRCLDPYLIHPAIQQRQKSLHFTEEIGTGYQSLKSLGFKPGMSKFYPDVFCNKEDGLGPFNLALYWKRKYREKGPKEAWFILTNLPKPQLG